MLKMRPALIVAGAVLCSAAAQAQDGLQVSAGVRAWYTQWTTFSYYAPAGKNLALTQVSAQEKLVLVPTFSLRQGDWLLAASAVPTASFSFADGGQGQRRELDLNVGYAIYPGLVATLGYKRVTQLGDGQRYEPRGAVFGLSGQAPLGGALALYGNLGLGQLKTAGGADIRFGARYRLAEMGLAYGWVGSGLPRRWALTAGYRIQLMSSYEALGSQDGQDTTQGLVFGVNASF
jgi:hypothetical protein